MGIAAVGAAVLNVVEHIDEHLHSEVRWLLVGAIAIILITIAALIGTVQLTPIEQKTLRTGRRVMLVSAVLIAILGFTALENIPLMVIIVILLLAPIISAIYSWLVALEQET